LGSLCLCIEKTTRYDIESYLPLIHGRNPYWTPYPDDNKLGITDKNLINEFEAKGITLAEHFVFGLESDTSISSKLILEIHSIAFSELYDWAGKWRTTDVIVGEFIPPKPHTLLHLIYQFINNLNFKISNSQNFQEHVETLTYAHDEFVRIHPFLNGNGRTGRILMNLVALKLGFKPIELYRREGNNRKIYIDAMKFADKSDFEPLAKLIREELSTF
jgi:cell filamentation protein